jgi:O-Antigen ligase
VADSFSDRVPKVALLLAVGAVLLPALALMAYSRPGYFTGPIYLGGLALAEFLFAAVCLYRRIFFPLVIVSFLMAGTSLPGAGGMWIAVRWAVLSTGAFVGSFMMLKERRHRFGLFHALAIFAILSAVVSAAVSRYQELAFMKAVSLLLLFVYAGTGARLAVTGHENRFFNGLLNGCEVFVGGIFLFQLVGVEVMGNPNSLGAVMGVVAAPILLWGTLLDEGSFVQRRRQIMFLLSLYLVFHSHARAGIVSAFISCAVLCLALRRYRMLGQGIVILLILVASSALFDPEDFSKTVNSITSSIVYKGNDEESVFASRQSPWQAAMHSIKSHLWFGSGFGTTDNGQDASAHIGQYQGFATAEGVTSENGSSYLSIVSWVGVLGVVPFVLLLAGILVFIARTVAWMINTGNPLHPAIPLAMMALAGLIHAAFEDWLFAVGYHLCVFFWSLAFVLVDIAPYAPLPRFSIRSRPQSAPMSWNGVPQTQ